MALVGWIVDQNRNGNAWCGLAFISSVLRTPYLTLLVGSLGSFASNQIRHDDVVPVLVFACST